MDESDELSGLEGMLELTGVSFAVMSYGKSQSLVAHLWTLHLTYQLFETDRCIEDSVLTAAQTSFNAK